VSVCSQGFLVTVVYAVTIRVGWSRGGGFTLLSFPQLAAIEVDRFPRNAPPVVRCWALWKTGLLSFDDDFDKSCLCANNYWGGFDRFVRRNARPGWSNWPGFRGLGLETGVLRSCPQVGSAHDEPPFLQIVYCSLNVSGLGVAVPPKADMQLSFR
jgi:hypothetical protein